jgi:3-oxoacyl-(acyl-carrier-protein) synthase
MHGHLLGAAGAIEAALCVASLARQTVPATPGHVPLDRRCAAVPVSTTARARPMRHILSNSFAFGGTNASIVLSSSATSRT